MRIASWNVNGIRAVATKGFEESLRKIDADVIGIQEIKALREQLGPEITDIPGYKSWFYSAERKGYSGTALYSRIDPVSVEFGFGVEEFDHEGRVIKADFGDFVLFNIYFPNGGRGDDYVKFKLKFYDCFLDQVDALKAKGKEVICCGDVNTAHKEIDLSNPKPIQRFPDSFPKNGLIWINSLKEVLRTPSGCFIRTIRNAIPGGLTRQRPESAT